MKEELRIFNAFIRAKGLRRTVQRERILEVFLATERHISTEELYRLVKKCHPAIGFVTVYRTMRLLVESGLCGEIDFGDGLIRFEHKYGHRHHGHLICLKCGRFIEVVNPEIEELQEKMARRHNFRPTKHKLEIFGFCQRCA
ncbi:MAG: transcriptional repressor [Candidatus Omnitrophica bacterium]|nr:transcriptional repressor [Candidatus Omnitrophota bacterium]